MPFSVDRNTIGPQPKRRAAVVLCLLCGEGILAAELILAVRQQSPTWNEPYHLLAGLRYCQLDDLGINPEHPPLAKWLAALPLLALPLRQPPGPRGTSKQEANVAARQFLFSQHADSLLFRARLAEGTFALALALLVFEIGYRWFGPATGLLALLITIFEPNLLAHGMLVTTDVGLSCCLLAAVYAFYRYAQQRSAVRLLECGFVVGLALAVKHSGILALPILFFLALTEIAARRLSSGSSTRATRSFEREVLAWMVALLVISLISVAVLWAFYGFRYAARPDGLRMTPSLAEFVRGLKSPLESRMILGLARWRLLPESYLYGLADVLITSAGPRPTFLFGRLYPRGQWFYFPAAFFIKSTLGFWGLLLLSLMARALRSSLVRRQVIFLTIPPVLFFAVSISSGLNIGVRHILPVYPFFLLLTAAGAWQLAKRRPRWAWVVAGLVGIHVFSSLRAFPDYLAYSNELFGGPANTYRVLTDSNVDWGQGLITAEHYLSQRHTTNCWLAYFGSADPDYYHLPCKLLPDLFTPWWGKPVDVAPPVYEGTVLVSATQAAGPYWGPSELNPYEQFLKARPIANLGGSILVFQGRFDLRVASAWSHIDKAWDMRATTPPDAAIQEARAAVALAPRLVAAHYMLGFLLAQAKLPVEARQEYQTALKLSQTIYPEYQWYWVPFLQARLAHL
jgi:4-amino-4-deoxy-L-arabinose transferase-like glycosyltransferase